MEDEVAVVEDDILPDDTGTDAPVTVAPGRTGGGLGSGIPPTRILGLVFGFLGGIALLWMSPTLLGSQLPRNQAASNPGIPNKPQDDGTVSEPGEPYLQSVILAGKQEYEKAIQQLEKEIAVHKVAAKRNSNANLNPTTDPGHQIFVRNCRQGQAYWRIRQALPDAVDRALPKLGQTKDIRLGAKEAETVKEFVVAKEKAPKLLLVRIGKAFTPKLKSPTEAKVVATL